MIPGKISLGFVAVVSLLSLFLSGCDEPVTLKSQWPAEPIHIDGDGSEWPATGTYFEKKSHVLISVMNDSRNIYIRLLTQSKESQMMFLQGGFTIWLDETGSKEKKFGIQYPLAVKQPTHGSMRDHKPRESMAEILEDSQQLLSILTDENDPQQEQTLSMSEASKMGIYPRLGIHHNHLIYELQLPRNTVPQNNSVTIGFESGKLAKPPAMDFPGGMPPGGRGGPPGGGPPGGGPPGGNSPDKNHPEPLALWITVLLEDAPDTPTATNSISK